MEIKTTITFTYKLDDSEVEQFRRRTLKYIKEELDYETTLTLDDIPTSKVKEYLANELATTIENNKQGHICDDCGIRYDEYFGTISLDYCDEYVADMVRELAEQIYENREEK
jgi:hypothetical protein